MEVSRLASRFGLEPPGLVQMEKEIDAEEARDQNDSSETTKIGTPNNIRHRYILFVLLLLLLLYRVDDLNVAVFRNESAATTPHFITTRQSESTNFFLSVTPMCHSSGLIAS